MSSRPSVAERWRLLFGLAPVFLAMAAYQGALGQGFVFDDHLFLGSWCWQIQDASELFEVASRPGCGYRPVRFVSLALDHLLWGGNPFGYHLTNVLLHGLATGLVVLLLRRLGLSRVAASRGALLWALHPVHTDVVTYVAGRRDVLSTVLFLVALLAWPWRWGRLSAGLARVAVALGAFWLAFQTKEMAITLPVVVGLILLLGPALRAARLGAGVPSPWRHVGHLARRHKLALGAGLALAMGGFVYRGLLHPMTLAAHRLWGGDLFHHLLTIPVVYAKYAQLILAPFGLYGDYSDYPPAAGLGDPRVWVGLAVLVVVWVGGIWQAGRRPWLALGLLWFGVTMLPVSQLVPHHELLAEHYLYLPLIGFAIAGARGLERARGRRWVPVGVGAVAVTWLVVIVDRNQDFTDDARFASVILEHVPDSVRGHLLLAHGQQVAGDLAGAIDSLRFALEHAEPGGRFHLSASQNLIVTLAAAGQLQAAERAAFRHLAAYPGDAEALRVLGTVRARQGLPQKGLVYLERAAQADPQDVEGQLHLGITLMRLGRVHDAEPHLAFAAQRWRDNADAQLEWALVAYERGQSEEARRRLEHVVALDPENTFALERLVVLARERGDHAEACVWFARLQPLREDLRDVELGCPEPSGP